MVKSLINLAPETDKPTLNAQLQPKVCMVTHDLPRSYSIFTAFSVLCRVAFVAFYRLLSVISTSHVHRLPQIYIM